MRGHRRAAMLAVALGLCLPPVCVAQPSYDTVLSRLAVAGERTRTAFVVAALDALIAQHQDAMAAARGGAHAADASWLAATGGYVTTLRALGERALAGARVRFLRERDGVLRVLVGHGAQRQFMLASPRPHEREALERDVVARFCGIATCRANVPATVFAHEPSSTAPSAAHGASAPPVVRPIRLGPGDGLTCPGPEARHRRLAERACRPLLAELRALAGALVPHAGAIDWQALTAAPRPEGNVHRVVFNRAGDAVRLPLPSLAASPATLAAAVGWMRGVLAGKVAPHALTPPSRMVYQASLAASGAP